MTADTPNLATLMPLLGQLTFGGFLGFAAGYALKKIGKVLLVIVGLLFVAVQLLAFLDVVTVHWDALQAAVAPLFRADMLERGWRALLDLLTHDLPLVAAFVPLLLLGFRRG